MTNSKKKSKYFKLKIDTETGEVKKPPMDEHDENATELTAEELEQFYQSDPEYLGTLFYTHSSPGCVYYILGGYAVKICF